MCGRELLADPLSKELAPENRPFAALLISKIYFYMGFQDEAVEFALKAGVAFGKESEGEYRETIIGSSCLVLVGEEEAGMLIQCGWICSWMLGSCD